MTASEAITDPGALSLAYGAGRVRVVPAAGRFSPVLAAVAPMLSDPARHLREALDEPIGTPPLRELLHPGDRATIVVSDQTRATGIRALLPSLLAYLESAGLSAKRIRVLFALGIHRRQTPAEQAEILGPEVAARIAHADHDCDDERALDTVAHGGTAAGIRLNRQVLDGSFVITTGAITFHYLAGFGGGRKAILPGVASRDSVLGFHGLSLAPGAGGERHPRVRPGVRAGNPLDVLAGIVGAALPRSFLINTIMSPAGEDRPGGNTGIMAIVAGDMARAFDRGSAIYQERFTVPIAARRPVAIVSAGGAPRDCDLVQAQKAIAAGAAALVPGGMMLVLAACPQGTGQAELLRWFKHPDRASHVAALRREFSVPGQTALALREHAERYRVYLRSELPAEVVASAGMVPIARLEDFFAAVAGRYGDDVEGYVLPEGARYLPVVEDGE
jgi:nickel-dependent lactate racemase